MAAVPAALRKADIARFALRAGQLEKAKPAVAYWCNYWIVEQILSKGLQNGDEESMAYSVNLMDKLEQAKNDAVSDDMASQAYIEQFGTETFQRAENAMNANKATRYFYPMRAGPLWMWLIVYDISRQTADTFSAAAVFLDLRQIWGPLDVEAISKSKFAKFHALRIIKALKAGEDPNQSNPAPEPMPKHEDQMLSPMDLDVQMLDSPTNFENDQPRPGQPFVEEVPDEDDRMQHRLARSSALDVSLHPSRATSNQRPPNGDTAWHPPEAPSPQGPGQDYYHIHPAGDVSPMASPTAVRAGSEDGGYFPSVTGQDTRAPATSLPRVPGEVPGVDSVLPQFQPATDFSQPYLADSSLHSFPPPPMDPASTLNQMPIPGQYQSQQHPAPVYRPNVPRQPIPRQHQPVSGGAPPRPPAPQSVDDLANYTTDEEAILKAQKHARWAISALNFEDVKTAVKELRGALESLGA